MVSKAAQELGKIGGQAKSERKTAAVRENAKKPRGKWVTAFGFVVCDDLNNEHFGHVMIEKNLNMDLEKNGEELWALMANAIHWNKPVGKLRLFHFQGQALRIGK